MARFCSVGANRRPVPSRLPDDSRPNNTYMPFSRGVPQNCAVFCPLPPRPALLRRKDAKKARPDAPFYFFSSVRPVFRRHPDLSERRKFGRNVERIA